MLSFANFVIGHTLEQLAESREAYLGVSLLIMDHTRLQLIKFENWQVGDNNGVQISLRANKRCLLISSKTNIAFAFF